MTSRKVRWGKMDVLLAILGLLPIIAALLLYHQLPDQMATHFGINGKPDGFQGKASFLAFAGLLTVGLPILMKFLRLIDPKRDNYEKFERGFEIIRLALTLILSCLIGTVLIFNLGYSINIQMFVLISIGLLYLVLGNYMGQLRFNYFIGVRTPWTLANEEVWRRTHRLAGPLFMLAGVVAIISAFLPGSAAIWLFATAIVIAVVVPLVYSCLLYRKITK